MANINIKKLLLGLAIVLLAIISAIFYLKQIGISACGGIDGEICPSGFFCKYPEFKGPTLVAESGKCVLGKTIDEDECIPPIGAPPNWEAPYTCLVR